MTKHNLLQAIQDYSNLAYIQGEKVGSGVVTLKESREDLGLRRLLQFIRIVNMLFALAPEKINKELLSRIK